MRRSRKPIVIASRRSRLAKTQAEMVGGALQRLHPAVAVEYLWLESEGDQIQGKPLAEHGGKGLFTRRIEQALLKGQADLAVHSLKDLPARDTPGLTIAAVPRREDVRDCLISRGGETSLDALPAGAVVGTSSPRRAAQVLRLRPDLQVALIRGNVETRLRKVLEGEGPAHYDATLLAAAGLRRLGMNDLAANTISTDLVLPASCQGALALQCRADDHVTLTRCLPLNDPAAATAVHAERSVLAELEASCDSAIAVLAEPCEPDEPSKRPDSHAFRLRVRVLSSDGTTCLEQDDKCRTKDLRRAVKRVVEELAGRGAKELLAKGGAIPLPQPRAQREDDLDAEKVTSPADV